MKKKSPRVDLELFVFRPSPYSKVDPRRRPELYNARFVQEDDQAIANLSPRFINQQFDQNRFVERLRMYDDGVDGE